MRGLLVGSFVVSLAMGMVGLLLPLYAAKELNASYTEVGLIGAAYIVFDVLFSIPAGLLGDRFGRRPFILTGFLLTSAGFLLYSACTSVTALLAVRLFQGAAEAPIWVNMQAAVVELSEERERGKAMGLYGSSWASGFGIGPILAGWLYPSIGASWSFLTAGVFGLASTGIVCFVYLGSARALPSFPSLRRLLPPCFATLIYIGAVALIHILLPAYGVVGLGLTEFQVGVLVTTFTLVRAISFTPLGGASDLIGAKRVILASILAISVLSAGISLVRGYLILVALISLLAVAEGAVYPAIVSAISKARGRGSLGAVLGIFNTVGMIGWGVFPAVGGALADSFGPPSPFLMFALAGLISLPLLHKLLK